MYPPHDIDRGARGEARTSTVVTRNDWLAYVLRTARSTAPDREAETESRAINGDRIAARETF